MKKKSWHLDRRTFLQGTGVSLALPFMNAMAVGSEKKALKSLPKRSAYIFFSNGVSMAPEGHAAHDDWHWWPKGEGRNFEFRQNLASLNPYRKDLTVISGLSNPLNRKMDPHHSPSGFLSCKQMVKGKTKNNSITIDQEVARHIGNQTQLSSLVLSTAGGVGQPTNPDTISCNARGKWIPAMSNLRAIYQRMYMANSPAAKARLLKQERLLNEVYGSAKDMKRRLGTEDQATLDEYLTSVTDLEKKVANDKLWLTRAAQNKPPKMNLNATYKDVENYVSSIYTLIYLAFKADITRVASYQWAPEGSKPANQMSLFIGLSKEVHALSHGRAANAFEEWGKWDQFIAKQFAFFINKLKETKEGEGTMLDRTLLFQGSGISRNHWNYNYPLILAGGRKLGHKSGQYIKYDEEKNALSNLYVRMGQALGAPVEKFGDSTGISMSEIFA